jgi:hypothetical protein
MSRKEDMEKLNSLVAEVNALAEKIRNDYAEEQEDDVLAEYIEAVNSGKYLLYWVNSSGDVKDGPGACVLDNYNPYSNYMNSIIADKAARMKKFNDMLLAFKWCYDTSYTPNWGDSDSQKYFIYYDTVMSMYAVDFFRGLAKNDVYFSTRIRAEDCANWLNKVDPKGELMK